MLELKYVYQMFENQLFFSIFMSNESHQKINYLSSLPGFAEQHGHKHQGGVNTDRRGEMNFEPDPYNNCFWLTGH